MICPADRQPCTGLHDESCRLECLRSLALRRDPRQPYTGAPAPEPKESRPSWLDRPVTYRGLLIFSIVTAPLVGIGRGIAQVWL